MSILGGTRGPQGTTLDDLRAAMVSNTAELAGVTAAISALADSNAAIAATLAALYASTGVVGSCSSGATLMEILCNISNHVNPLTVSNKEQREVTRGLIRDISSQIGGARPSDLPPSFCPGYVDGITTRCAYIEPYRPIGEDTGSGHAVFHSFNEPAILRASKHLYEVGGSQVWVPSFRLAPGTALDAVVCVGARTSGVGASVRVMRFNPSTGVGDPDSYSTTHTIDTGSVPGATSGTVALDPGVDYVIRTGVGDGSMDYLRVAVWMTCLEPI